MRISFAKAFLAGVAGTAVFDLLGLVLTGKFWDVPSLLDARLFGGVGLGVGVFAHYVIGVLLAVVYAGVAPSLWGSRWTRALTYITVQTVFGVYLFMLPMLGLGVFGLEAGLLLPVFSMLRHWAYALVVEAVYRTRTRSAVTHVAAEAA